MRQSRRALLAALMAPLPAGALAAVPGWPALLPPRPAHAPRPSDVCFSSRWKHPSGPDDPHDALRAAKGFGATRLDWHYGADGAFLAACRAAGMGVLGGALNTILTDSPGSRERLRGRILDREGRPVTAPWMRWPGVAWGCANSPDYRASFIAHAQRGLAAGIDWFQMDDPGLNVAAIKWGGCFCPHCRARAAVEGVSLESDMEAFQRRSVTRFYAETRAEIDRIAGRRVSFAGNNFSLGQGWPYELFDFGMGELPGRLAQPRPIAEALIAAERAGRPQTITLTESDTALNRRVLAWAYACGGHMLAPWDVYLRSTEAGSDRLFADPADYAPLYAFARRLGPLLDEAAPMAVLAPGTAPWLSTAPGTWAVLRGSPERRFLALHLVAWEGTGVGEFRLDTAGLPAAGAMVVHRPDGMAEPPWVVVEIRA